MTIFSLVLGLTLLLFGGELLVRGAVAAARALNVSPLVIGVTLVGFGTSAPELVTSIDAALIGSPGIAIGNVVGSNIANILLILGLAATIAPLLASPRAFVRDGPALLGASLVLLLLCHTGRLDRPGGALLIALLVAFVAFSYISDRRLANGSAVLHLAEADSVTPLRRPFPLTLLLLALGFAGVLLGADLLVGAALELAWRWKASETVIGLTLVAIGTSLPELVTSVVAAVRRQGDIALGNIVGSNIFNSLGIVGVTALVKPLTVPPELVRFDSWVMLGAAVLLVGFVFAGRCLRRREGAALLALYAGYVAVLLSPAARTHFGLD